MAPLRKELTNSEHQLSGKVVSNFWTDKQLFLDMINSWWNRDNHNFLLFLMILKQYVESIFENEVQELWVMLDNAAIHWTEVTRRTAAYYNFQMNYLPPYWPHLAPVEVVFGIAKRNLINLKTGVQVNFSKATGKKIIVDSFNTIKPSTMSELWTRFIGEAKATTGAD